MKTFEDYIKQMIEDGYWSENGLAPLKCIHCDSKNLEDRNHEFENLGYVAYERWCVDCEKLVNTWSYGQWDL